MLVKLFEAWKISHLVFEKDTDAYARERDEDVIKQAKEAGVEVIVKMGRTLYDPDELGTLSFRSKFSLSVPFSESWDTLH